MKRVLIILLWLIAIHSFLVGIALIVIPSSGLPFFGFQDYEEKFFRTQAGVFHFIMCFIYIVTAENIVKFDGLIFVTIAIKFIAAVFLFIYYFLAAQIWTVILSGIADLLMGVVVLVLYQLYLKNKIIRT